MSTLREAAQAVVAQWDTPNWKLTVHTGILIDRLRAALAQPLDALPDGWQARRIDPDEGPGIWQPCTQSDAASYGALPRFEVRPLYAHQPRDEVMS